jgi:hypothetical protein
MNDKKRTIAIKIHVPPADASREDKVKAYGTALALVDAMFDVEGVRTKAWAAQTDVRFQRFLTRLLGRMDRTELHPE